MRFLIILGLLIALVPDDCYAKYATVQNQTESESREKGGRVLPVFQVVRFQVSTHSVLNLAKDFLSATE